MKQYIKEKLEIGSNGNGNSEQGEEIEEEISININNNINKVNKISYKAKALIDEQWKIIRRI